MLRRLSPIPDVDSNRKQRRISVGSLGSQGLIYAIFVVIIGFFMIFAPNFATATTFADIGRETAVTTIVAVGMTLVIITAEIDLSIGSTVSFTGLMAAILMQSHVGWLPASLASLAIGALIGALNGFVTTYVGVPSFLVTLGTMEIFGGLSQIITGSMPVPVDSVSFGYIFGDNALLGIPIPVWWTLIIVVLGFVLLHRSVFGRWIYATGGNKTAARFSGIQVNRIKMYCFILLGIFGAVGGLILDGRFGAGDPSVGNGMELDAIAATILGGTNLFGGRGTIVGTIIGSIFIGSVSVGLIMLGAGAELQTVVKGAIIIGAVALNKISDKRRV